MVSYSRSTNGNVNMSIPSSIFEGNFNTHLFGKSFWHYRELKIDCWTSRHILCKKILNAFVCVEIRIHVEKFNIYEGHICQRPLLQTCRLETTSLCLNKRLCVNKHLQNLIIFIEINVIVFLLCAHHVMTSIILHTRRPNCQYKVCYALGFMFHLIFYFRILRSWKARFSHSSISHHEVCTTEFQLLGVQ